MRIGIALSGGGARGIAHVGVLQALHEHNIYPEVVAGASAGAIVGGLYAAGHSPETIMEFVKDSSLLRLFKVGLPIGGVAKLTYLKERLAAYIPEDSFESLKHRLFVAITNLNTGECEIRSSGVLYDVIMASCSIPLVFKPVEIEGQIYVDGGVLNNLPVAPLAPYSDLRIGVNVIPHVKTSNKNIQSLMGIANRCFELSILANTRPNLNLCDMLIEPRRVHGFNIFQFNQSERLFEIGYRAAQDRIPELQALIQLKQAALYKAG